MVKGRSRKVNRKKGKSSRKSRWRYLNWSLMIGIWLVACFGLLFLWFSYDLPDLGDLKNLTRRPGITILDRQGRVLATRGDIFGEAISVHNVPAHVYQAILAIEDRRFYHHSGVDLWGILRAAYINVQAGRVIQGGSTLTQQLAKNFLLSQQKFKAYDRSFKRKIQELLLSLWMERVFTKDQILTIYMNRVYLGSGVYGIQAAARKYFKKSAKDLNLVEAATLAGFLKGPTFYASFHHPQRAQQRAEVVLNAMQEAGYISAAERQTRQASPLPPANDLSVSAGYFVDWILGQLPHYVKDLNNDLIIHTTLDTSVQQKVVQKTYNMLETAKEQDVSQAAVVVMHNNGAVRGMLGGIDYRASQFNRSTQAQRQMGSAYKLFIYLEALRQGYKPSHLISDAPIQIGQWKPKNYGWKLQGQVTLENAFAYSINTTTVRLGRTLGVKSINKLAYDLGIQSKQPTDLSVLLGSGSASLLELTGAYGCVARGGVRIDPYGIEKITTPRGQVLYQRSSPPPPRILSQAHSAQMIQLLKSVVAYGTGKAAQLPGAAGKTGTSQHSRDAWFVGFADHPGYVTGVWMGNDEMKSMKNVTGGGLPARLWKEIMLSLR